MKETENIMDAVTKVTGICKRKMLSRSRLWPIVEARMLFVLFMSRTGHIDEVTASALGRNRTTILKTRHTAESYVTVSKSFQDKYAKLSAQYGS